jgi:hypothetical protein
MAPAGCQKGPRFAHNSPRGSDLYVRGSHPKPRLFELDRGRIVRVPLRWKSVAGFSALARSSNAGLWVASCRCVLACAFSTDDNRGGFPMRLWNTGYNARRAIAPGLAGSQRHQRRHASLLPALEWIEFSGRRRTLDYIVDSSDSTRARGGRPNQAASAKPRHALPGFPSPLHTDSFGDGGIRTSAD